jgi:capsular exopolysaccharide synthesis family protein
MFVLNPNYNGNSISKPYFLDLVRAKNLGAGLLSGLKIESNKLSSVIELTFKDEVPERAENILNTLIEYYNKSTIAEKNNLVKNTLASIEARLEVVSSALDSIQKKVKNYRASHGAINLSQQGDQYLSMVGRSDQELSQVSTQLSQLNDLKRVVTSNENIGVLPSASGISDRTLADQMTALNNAQLEYERLKKTVGEGNPLLAGYREQIGKMKPNILGNIDAQIRNLQQNQRSVSSSSGKYNSMLSAIPEQERELLEISRDQNIQNGIYQFLLQKREESVLSYTKENSDSKVINYAKSSGSPVSPKTSMIYIAALLLGLMLPIIFVNGREMLNNKILYRKEIESLTSIPVIGEIVHNKTKSSLVLEPGKRSFIAEEFRKIRVSLLFLGIDSYHKKILLTSSIPGEGKSFIAANLAVSLAMTGKKVVLVDADLHNPSLGKLFGVTTEEIGVSDYLLGERTADEIIRKVENHKNLSFVSSGGLHPTPSELLENGEIQKLINYLESNFDLVVIDTAPVVMVTDAYHLSSLADATLYIVRHKYTPKMLVKRIDENNKINSLKNPAIIFNGIKTRGFMKNNYGYGYDYVYGGNQKISKGKKLKA